MQVIPITIEKKLFPVKKIIEFHGETIAYEVETFSKDFENSEQGGFFDLSNWGVIEIAGPDSLDYLQRMSTANVKSLSIGLSASGAFLTGKGTLISVGTFLLVEANRFLFIVSPNQTENALTHLEMFHFQEKIEIKDRTSELALIGLWRSKENLLKQSWQSSREKNLSYALLPRDEYGKVILELHKQGLAFLGMRLFHYFRIQAGLPWMGWEVGPADLVLEAGLDDFVTRNKGCYPGQEVVERIFTYGQVNRKLMRVKIEGQGLESVPQEQEIKQDDGTVVGTLKSLMANPKLEDPGFGLAYVRKAFWESTAEYRTDIGLKIKWDPVPGEVPNG